MFKNLVTLVTGGASGLGRATASRFANKGAKVVVCDLPSSDGAEVVKEMGENAQFIPADVTSESDIQGMVEEISKKYGKLNVLVNCAGLAEAHVAYNFSSKTIKPLYAFRKILLTNALGTFHVTRLAVGLMGQNEPDSDGLRGVVINTAGVEAFQGTLGQSSTAAASGAIHSMTRPLASDFAEQGIRMVTVAPGFIKTPLIDYLPQDTDENIANECILAPKRLGDPDESLH